MVKAEHVFLNPYAVRTIVLLSIFALLFRLKVYCTNSTSAYSTTSKPVTPQHPLMFKLKYNYYNYYNFVRLSNVGVL